MMDSGNRSPLLETLLIRDQEIEQFCTTLNETQDSSAQAHAAKGIARSLCFAANALIDSTLSGQLYRPTGSFDDRSDRYTIREIGHWLDANFHWPAPGATHDLIAFYEELRSVAATGGNLTHPGLSLAAAVEPIAESACRVAREVDASSGRGVSNQTSLAPKARRAGATMLTTASLVLSMAALPGDLAALPHDLSTLSAVAYQAVDQLRRVATEVAVEIEVAALSMSPSAATERSTTRRGNGRPLADVDLDAELAAAQLGDSVDAELKAMRRQHSVQPLAKDEDEPEPPEYVTS